MRLRTRSRVRILLGAGAALVLIGVLWIVFTGSDDDEENDGWVLPSNPSDTNRGSGLINSSPSPAPSADTGDADSALQQGQSTAISQFNPDGLGGTGFTSNLPAQAWAASVSSRGPITTIGYYIPTSTQHQYDVIHDVGPSWSLSTSVYGRPDYGRVFVQAGLEGTPVTCVITVNGVERDRRTASGPYGQAMCQG